MGRTLNPVTKHCPVGTPDNIMAFHIREIVDLINEVRQSTPKITHGTIAHQVSAMMPEGESVSELSMRKYLNTGLAKWSEPRDTLGHALRMWYVCYLANNLNAPTIPEIEKTKRAKALW